MPNMLTPEALALIAATFVAGAVEVVEALTIVLAMGLTRGWKATIVGSIVALIALGIITAVMGVALNQYVSQALLQFFIGTLLLVFGLQWLRKAILRASGLKAIHDEEKIFKKEQEAAAKASGETRFGLDWFAFVVSFKGVFLEGTEVVFIVLTFGLAAQAKHVEHAIAVASAGAALAALVVVTAGAIVRKPLSRVPENAMKFGVGLLLSTFGTFWSVEGLGYFGRAGGSFEWPMGDWALLVLLVIWIVVSLSAVAVLRRLTQRAAEAAVPAVVEGEPT
jgi:Ca2+/H+ antiporter, TMEM165/GDT1 family